MFTKTLLLALAATPLALAHGKVAVVVGDAGGNGTALGIMGAVVPGTGHNSKTEVDTTVFKSTKIATNGLGETTENGDLHTSDLKAAMALSGSTLPQVHSAIQATFHVVTSDGCGPLKAVVDPTGEGKFEDGTELETTADVDGDDGECPSSITKRGLLRRLLERSGVIAKRASNVNMDFQVAFAVPEGTTCTGTVHGVENTCLVKIANNNKNGPFGGVVAIQMAGGNSTAKRSTRVFQG